MGQAAGVDSAGRLGGHYLRRGLSEILEAGPTRRSFCGFNERCKYNGHSTAIFSHETLKYNGVEILNGFISYWVLGLPT